jgi:hypothetical protein
MNIEIDGENLAYTLEQESVLQELLPALRLYVFGQGRFIEQIRLDGKPLLDKNTAIGQIEQLSIDTSAVLELDVVLMRAKNLLLRVESGEGCDLSGCAGNIVAFAKSCEFWLQDFSLNEEFFTLLTTLPEYDGQAERRELYQKSLQAVLRCLQERNTELEQPVAVVLHSMQALLEKEQAMSDLGSSLQANKDASTAYEILLFMEALQKLKRTMVLLPAEFDAIYGQLESWVGEVMGFMQPMIEAFDKKDFVLVADLAEYEVASRLAVLKELETTLQSLLVAQQ